MPIIFFCKSFAVILKGSIFAENNFNNINCKHMKNVIKRPLKIIAAAMFMVALGYGVATNSKVSELSSFINLSALSSVSAQGEEGGGGSSGSWPCFSTYSYCWFWRCSSIYYCGNPCTSVSADDWDLRGTCSSH